MTTLANSGSTTGRNATVQRHLEAKSDPRSNGQLDSKEVRPAVNERGNVMAAFIGNDPRVFEIATLSLRLRWPDATMLEANTVAAGLTLVGQTSPDLLLLHPDNTDMSLSQTIQELRRRSPAPLLVLGYQGDDMEVITALEAGADDYVRLPCDLTEIMTRLWALLRRTGPHSIHASDGPLRSGRLFIDPSGYEAIFNGERLALTSTEFRLLHLLARNRGVVVQHDTLERAIWGEQTDNTGLVKKYVQRLRHKLGDDARMPRWIASVHGVGYRFIGPAPGSAEQSA